MSDERQFPMLWGYEERRTPGLRLKSVPWAFLAPHEARARANHGQTLERLAERGGLGVRRENRPVAPQRAWLEVSRSHRPDELEPAMTPRPLWRWWLFCVACWAHRRTGSPHALALLGWCVLPAWLGYEPGDCDEPHGEVPF